jgi:hypothetical protein
MLKDRCYASARHACLLRPGNLQSVAVWRVDKPEGVPGRTSRMKAEQACLAIQRNPTIKTIVFLDVDPDAVRP